MKDSKRNRILKLHIISKDNFQMCFKQWKICLNKCVEWQKNYFQENKCFIHCLFLFLVTTDLVLILFEHILYCILVKIGYVEVRNIYTSQFLVFLNVYHFKTILKLTMYFILKLPIRAYSFYKSTLFIPNELFCIQSYNKFNSQNSYSHYY